VDAVVELLLYVGGLAGAAHHADERRYRLARGVVGLELYHVHGLGDVGVDLLRAGQHYELVGALAYQVEVALVVAPDQGALFRRDGVDAGQPDAGLLYPGNDVSQHRLDEGRRLRLDILTEIPREDVGDAIAVEVRAGAGRMHGALASDLVDAVADVGLHHLDAGVLQ